MKNKTLTYLALSLLCCICETSVRKRNIRTSPTCVYGSTGATSAKMRFRQKCTS